MKQTLVSPASDNPSRRIFLRNSGLLLAVLGTGALFPASKARADDDGMLTQASVHYQMTPNKGQQCSGCAYFIPGKTPADTGSCRLVGGTIYPNGWCERFSA